MRRLLSDLNVVELANGGAGAYCGKLFADLGARVTKVEQPGGDPLRRLAAPDDPSSPLGAFVHLNTNKRSVVVDPDDQAGVDRLWQLLEGADLVVQESGSGPGGFDLGWEEVHRRAPALVVVKISGFGATGPYADYRWTDLIAQTLSGTLLLQNSEQDPLRLPGQVGLCFVGNMAAVGGLAAVLLARAGDPGRLVDCAAVDALASMPSRATVLLAFQYRGGAGGVAVPNASRETLIPTGVFPCADGYMAMMSTPQQLGEMLEVLDSDELRAAFARPDVFERGDTKEAIDAALYPWLLSHTTPRPRQPPRRSAGRWPGSTPSRRSSAPTTCTSAAFGSTPMTPAPARSIFPAPRSATPKEGGQSAAWLRKSASTRRRWTTPRRRASKPRRPRGRRPPTPWPGRAASRSRGSACST